jgi:hypothetical protein
MIKVKQQELPGSCVDWFGVHLGAKNRQKLLEKFGSCK